VLPTTVGKLAQSLASVTHDLGKHAESLGSVSHDPGKLAESLSSIAQDLGKLDEDFASVDSRRVKLGEGRTGPRLRGVLQEVDARAPRRSGGFLSETGMDGCQKIARPLCMRPRAPAARTAPVPKSPSPRSAPSPS
jgi:hypothetical protein